MSATAAIELFQLALAYAKEAGLPVQRAAAAVPSVSVALAQANRARLPFEDLIALLQAISDASGDPDFGLHLAEAWFPVLQRHVLFGLLLNSATGLEALGKFLRYHHLLSDGIHPALIASAGRTYIELRDGVVTEPDVRRHFHEATSGLTVLFLRQFLGERFRPLGVEFRHERPRSAAEHQRLFGCEVEFSAPRTRVIVASEPLARPLPLADKALQQVLEAYVRERLGAQEASLGTAKRASQLVAQTLLQGDSVRLEGIAAQLGVGPRRLQQLLRQEGTSFQAVLDGVRKDLALKYLAQAHLSLCDVAFLLGFADQSAFSHAFRRWTGAAPSSARPKRTR